MPNTSEFNCKKPAPIDDDDEVTVAAIHEGVRDAKAGRTVPAKKVRKLFRLWIADSSSHKKR
jgi:predicted transcriptional regulator